jgi:hypothetical protein
MVRWCSVRLGVNFVVEMRGNDLVWNQRRKDWGQEDSNVRLGTAVIFVGSGWEKVRGLEDESSTLGPGV